MNKIELPASTATVKHAIGGDVGGNSQETIIEVESDGGQFDFTEIEKTKTGFRIKIIGTWEAGEFLSAMAKLVRHHGAWEVIEMEYLKNLGESDVR